MLVGTVDAFGPTTGTTLTSTKPLTPAMSGMARSKKARTILDVMTYGKGAEIWPECNEETVQLRDSFPNGIIPMAAMDALGSPLLAAKTGIDSNDSSSSSSSPSVPIEAKAEIATNKSFGSVDRIPGIVAIGLLGAGLIRPTDLMVVSGAVAYVAVLEYFARSVRGDGITPILPSLPPQGHVPDLVASPLGYSFSNSDDYDTWLRSGVFLSLFLPIATIARYMVGSNQQVDLARACARPLFLLCIQGLTESMTRRVMVCICVCVCVREREWSENE